MVDDASQLDEIAGFGELRHDEEADLGALLESLQPRQFLIFRPGEPAEVVSSLHQKGGVAIYLSKDELLFHMGSGRFAAELASPPILASPSCH